MFNSKNVKILCIILMGSIFLLSIFLIVTGIRGIIVQNPFAIISLILGLFLPLGVYVIVSVIFALFNIDKNLHLLNQKVDIVTSILRSNVTKKGDFIKSETVVNGISSNHEIVMETKQNDKITLTQVTIDFINQKYNINIDIDDDLEVIKQKVSIIGQNTTAVKVLKEKILNANSIEEVAQTFILHKAAYR